MRFSLNGNREASAELVASQMFREQCRVFDSSKLARPELTPLITRQRQIKGRLGRLQGPLTDTKPQPLTWKDWRPGINRRDEGRREWNKNEPHKAWFPHLCMSALGCNHIVSNKRCWLETPGLGVTRSLAFYQVPRENNTF